MKSTKQIIIIALSAVIACGLFMACSSEKRHAPLEQGFLNPPDSIKTGVYWYWVSDNISKEGVIADLRSMKEVGINIAWIGLVGPSVRHIYNHPYGKVKFFSDEWWEIIHAALKTATELDIEIGFFNSPAWSQSGGPWVKPWQSMRYLSSSEILVTGPTKISIKLPAPTENFQEIKTVACPVTFKDADDKQLSRLFERTGDAGLIFSHDTYVKRHAASMAIPAGKTMVIDPDKVLDISTTVKANAWFISEKAVYLDQEGTVIWDVPEGTWLIRRTGMTPTGIANSPASPEATGLEADKMSKEHITAHFHAFMGKIMERIPAADRKCWKYVILDSYEKRGQNVTDDMLTTFESRFGYDPLPFLPALNGYLVGNEELTKRFLWDMRRFVADELAYQYVAGMREVSNRHGLKTWLENYGHNGFYGEFLQYGGQSDEVAGEFWQFGGFSNVHTSASTAHIYNKKRVWAESLTHDNRSDEHTFQLYPASGKARVDRAFSAGINSVLYHVYIQQYADDSYPGVDAWFGTEFNRKNTWFYQLKPFIDYTKRCSYMLQQGMSVADVAYYTGEDTPMHGGDMIPKLPKGYDYDFINSEVLINSLEVADGKLVLPHGMAYRVLVLPPQEHIRPEVLRKIENLVAAGATIIGNPPNHSPSLQHYPEADNEIQALAAKMWALPDGADGKAKRNIRYGKGSIFVNTTLEEVLDLLNVPPDCLVADDEHVLYAHRAQDKDFDLYFLTNQSDKKIRINPQFRITDRQPELWDAVTGTVRTLPVCEQNGVTTTVPMQLEANESMFVVFRNRAAAHTSGINENFPAPKLLLNIENPWQVRFESDDNKRGPKEPITFNQLSDWSEHGDVRIKYYSGTGFYETSFEMDKIPEGQVYLDLGKVCYVAKVKLNGTAVGGAWTVPYRVNITDAIRKGKNTIEVEVANTWFNRIYGDLQLPENERKVVPFTMYTMYTKLWDKDMHLQKSGLLGPVSIISMNY